VTTPSARVVYALANELGITLDSLFSTEGAASADPVGMAHTGADHRGSAANVAATPDTATSPWGRATGPDGASIVQRADHCRIIELSSGVRWERLTPTHDSKVDFLKVVYAPGGQSSDSGRASDTTAVNTSMPCKANSKSSSDSTPSVSSREIPWPSTRQRRITTETV
jgi:hypothetical protein